MTSRTIHAVDLLLHISALCIVLGSLLIIFFREERAVSEEIIPETVKTLPSIIPDINPKLVKKPITSEIEEEMEMSALFYAVEPIGRYYITAYSHLETGSKITASGTTCHEGNITTCAADVPKYFHFGDYIEVGGQIYRVEDTGSAVKKKHIDIYLGGNDIKRVKNYPSHYETIYKVTFPFGKPQD